jgi:hypothetical protein
VVRKARLIQTREVVIFKYSNNVDLKEWASSQSDEEAVLAAINHKNVIRLIQPTRKGVYSKILKMGG